ncbi:MAG: hypothetical protein ACOYA8_08085 [Clostridium sp.]
MMAWARSEAEKDTMEYNAETGNVSVSLSKSAYIPKNEKRCFPVGYLFLQKLCTELKIDSVCRKISKRHKYTYDFSAILTDQIFSRFVLEKADLTLINMLSKTKKVITTPPPVLCSVASYKQFYSKT